MTKIEWTEVTWNPIVGCSVATPGCTNCYAMRMAHRLGRNPKTPHYAGLTQDSRGGPVWNGKLTLAPDHVIEAPLHRRKPTTYFVNSMGDLFHEDVPDEWIDQVFAVMALCPQHRFQVLTKRADRMRYWVRAGGTINRVAEAMRSIAPKPCMSVADAAKQFGHELTAPWWPLPNVWLGVSAEDQARADGRIPDLLATPAAVRFVSAEPLLGPVDLTEATRRFLRHPSYLNLSLHWVIVGGESGPDARPMHPDWARSLRDQCQAAGVAFFFKQWGEWAPGEIAGPNERPIDAATWWNEVWNIERVGKSQPDQRYDEEPDLFRIGKRAAGRLLDGREWNQMPEGENCE